MLDFCRSSHTYSTLFATYIAISNSTVLCLNLSQAVSECDVETVDNWILYLKSNPLENGKKIVDQFSSKTKDVANPFYNAVHHAVVNNDVHMLYKLSTVGGAGTKLLMYVYSDIHSFYIVH